MEEQAQNSRSAQEIQQTSPVEQIRRPTDRLFIFVFPIIMLAWLGIGISALCAKPSYGQERQREDFQLYINAPFSRFRFMYIIQFVISLVLSTGFTLLGIFLNKKFTKFFVYLGIGIYILSTIGVCFTVLFGNMKYPNDKLSPSQEVVFVYVSSVSRTWFFLKAIFMIVCVISFFKVEKNEILDVAKDCCRIILGSPLMILFAGFFIVFSYLVFLFTANAIATDITSNRGEFHILFDIFILMIGGVGALSFVSNFALMAISQYTVNYYWKKGDNPAVGQSAFQILKNHTGTIMFSCIPYVPFIFAVVQAVKHNRSPRNKENYFFYLASKIFLVLNIECFALIVSSIYGTGFVNSMKKTLDTVLRRCLFFLATSAVIEAIISIIAAIVAVLAAIALGITLLFTGSYKRTSPESLMNMASLLLGFSIPLTSFAISMYFSAKALLINKIIILNNEE